MLPQLYKQIYRLFLAFFLLMAFAGSFAALAQTPQVVSFEKRTQILKAGADGFIYTLGKFTQSIDLDPGPGSFVLTPSSSGTDSYLQKLDTNGNFVNAIQFDYGSLSIQDFAVDINGAIYITGQFDGTIDMDPGAGVVNITSIGSSIYSQDNSLLVKLNPNGSYAWGHPLLVNQFSHGQYLDLDAAGNVYLMGRMLGNGMDFEPGSGVTALGHPSQFGIFAAKYTTSGSLVYARFFGHLSLFDFNETMAVDAAGNLYFGGSIQFDLDVDPSATTTLISGQVCSGPGNEREAFWIKLNTAGNLDWYKALGQCNADGLVDMTLNDAGEPVIVWIDAVCTTNSVNDCTSPTNNYYLEKYTPSGNLVWSTPLPAGTFASDISFARDANGNEHYYTMGGYSNPTTWSNGTVFPAPPTNRRHPWTGSFSNLGQLEWATYFTANDWSFHGAFSRNTPFSGCIFQSGAYADSINFDPPNGNDILTGGQSGYLIKIQLPTPCTVLTSTLTATACGSFSLPGSNQVYTSTGQYQDTLTASNGCDSVVTLNLTILPLPTQTLNVNTCGAYTSPSGTVYSMSGTYTDTLPGPGGCDTLLTINLNTQVLNVSLTPNNSGCTGNGGSMSTSVQGGSGPFTYLWSNGATTATLSGLSSGTFTVTVSNAQGCTGTANASVLGAGPLTINLTTTPETCPGNDGTITSAISGATAPFTYLWPTTATTANLSGLNADVYFVTVTDANGCSNTANTPVTNLNNCPPVLSANLCGTTVTTLSDQIPHTAFPGATDYRYRITTGSTSFVHVRGAAIAHFAFAVVPGIQYNTNYTVEVAAFANGVWSAYGPTCALSTPPQPPTTQLGPTYCGVTVSSLSSWLFSNYVPGSTDYRYEVTNSSGFNQVFTRGWASTAFRMSFITGIANSTTYQVRVAVEVNGVWGPYGTACSVTTPSFGALPSLVSSQCNSTIPTWQSFVFYRTVPGATAYRLEFMAGGFNTVFVRNTPNPLIRLDWVPGLALATTYNVRVAANVGGVWSAYGPTCTLTTPASLRLATVVPDDNTTAPTDNIAVPTELKVMLFPNPNNGQFQIDLGNTESATVTIFSTLGALVHQQRLAGRLSEINAKNLSSGIYLVKVEADGLVIFERMIVE